MKRIHLFEFEDLTWFPSFLRNYMTDFLQFLTNKTKLFQPVIPIIEKGIKKSGMNRIIDMGSGGGGGLLWISEELQKSNPDLQIILTDLYPNIATFEYTKQQGRNFDYVSESVDARDVPNDLKGLRTQFLSLHHFNPKDAKKILQNAVVSKQNIAIFEGQERSFSSIFAMIFSPITVLLVTPFIRPFSFGRIIFTYLIPLVPIFVLWDGVVSSLRTYSVKEMENLVDELENKDEFDWEIGRKKSGPGVNLYLLGTLKK
ncbi:MAG: hypothetical protein J7K34_06030 [Flavobacteriaceae bacterium]|nr:hypothetical protein [Flavobacteriaceae bacterium]